MNRRDFLTSTAMTGAAIALPFAASAVTVGVDLAGGPDETVIYLSTPKPDCDWMLRFWEHQRDEVRRAFYVPTNLVN